MKFYGDFLLTNANVPFEFNTFSSDDPSASVTVTDLAVGDVYIHKNGAAAAGTPGGKTLRLNVGSANGNHLLVLDLTDTTDAGFYANGNVYSIRLEGITVDGATLNVFIGSFTIGMLANATDQASILADTNELQTDWKDGGRLDAKLDLAAAAAGSGAATISMYTKDEDNVAIAGVDVWIATDAAGTTVVAGKLVTDTFGLTTFYLDAGTYYVFRQLSGYTFTNPQTLVVTATATVTYADGVAAATGTGESGLTLGWADLKKEVGLYLGLGSSGWATAVESRIEDIVHSGIRLVYYPPAIGQETVGHEWSFLRPKTNLTLVVPYTTGTVTIVDGVVTLVTGTWPTWAASATLMLSSGDYEVGTRDSDTQITLQDTTVAADALTEYSLVRNYYDLPDDFNRLVHGFHYSANQYKRDIKQISVSELLAMRSSRMYTGTPIYCATRYKESAGQNGQRSEVMFYPDPDTAFVLTYQYEAYSGKLSTSYPYPLGGSHLSELFLESCLAVAERRTERDVSIHNDQYQRLLVDAVSRDGARGGQVFGQMGHVERVEELFRRGWTGGTYPILYDGEYR